MSENILLRAHNTLFFFIIAISFHYYFYSLLEAEMLQRTVTLVNISLKLFLPQITRLNENFSRNSTFTMVTH